VIEVQEYARLSESYPDLLNEVISYGDEVDMGSRGGLTKEFIGYSLCLTEPKYCVVSRTGFSLAFMDAEIALLLAGDYDDALIRAVTPVAADLITKSTAYGPRIWPQIGYVEEELQEHGESRRGVVYIGRPDDLSAVREGQDDRAGEMPCTEKLQFLLRKERLHMVVSMRSWDLVWGLCYDIPNFVALQMAMARSIGVEVGEYYHMAGSAHVYEKHWDLTVMGRKEGGELQIPWLRNDLYSTRSAARDVVQSMKEERGV
jgi:thymidylate synthase